MSTSTFTLASSSGSNYYFPYPDWGKPKNGIQKDIQLFNMWKDDSIETVDKGVNNRELTIGGTICIEGEWEGVCFPICVDELCFSNKLSNMLSNLKTDMNNGCYFTINELGNCLNGVYIIKNFRFKTIKKIPSCYEWELNMELKREVS